MNFEEKYEDYYKWHTPHTKTEMEEMYNFARLELLKEIERMIDENTMTRVVNRTATSVLDANQFKDKIAELKRSHK